VCPIRLLAILLLRLLLHPLLHPRPRHRGTLLHLLLVLHRLLDHVGIRNVPALLDARPAHHALLPRLHVRELLDIDARPAGRHDPPDVRDVSDCAAIADEVAGWHRGEVFVEDGVQAARFVDVAFYTVFDFFGGVAGEVVGLALHGTYTCVLGFVNRSGLRV
jgi:hypothetical protein